MTNRNKSQAGVLAYTRMLYTAMGKSMLSRYTVFTASLVSMMLLARVFAPEAFGTVASITVFLLFFQLMAEAGLGPAIINLENLAPTDRDGLFGLTLAVGAVLAVSLYFLSPVFVAFYQLPRVDEVVPYVAVALFFFAAAIVPTALLLRDQAFFRIAKAGLIAEVASAAIAVAMAQLTDPLHALAARGVCAAGANFLVLYYYSASTEFGRPKWGMHFSAIKPLWSFSAYQMGFNFINYFSRNLDNILVGKYLGATSLGVYDKAYQLMRYPLMLLTFSMTPAIQPIVRRYADDIALVEAIHRDFTFKLSLVGALAGLAMSWLSEWVVLLLLGPQWTEVVPIIQVLAVAIPVQVVFSATGSFFQAVNRADLMFLTGALCAIPMVLAIVWGVYQRNMISLSWAVVAAFHVNFIQAYYIMYSRVFRKSLSKFLIRMTPASAVVVGMVLWHHGTWI